MGVLVTNEVTISVQLKLDPCQADAEARAHALVTAAFSEAAGPGAVVQVRSAAGAATKADRKELGPDELRDVLQMLLTGADGNKPLNEGERTMLKLIAIEAPDAMPYDHLNRALGSGAKFGNVSSGLARRFWSRGYELPYEPDPENTGYVMDPEIAKVVMVVVASDETPHDKE